MCENKILTDKRNFSLDTLKGIAAIFVVFIHAKFPGVFGDIMSTISEFSVQIFFLTSGYFVFGANGKKVINNIFQIVKFIVIAYILNLARIFISF